MRICEEALQDWTESEVDTKEDPYFPECVKPDLTIESIQYILFLLRSALE
jgi:hypothetical protein